MIQMLRSVRSAYATALDRQARYEERNIGRRKRPTIRAASRQVYTLLYQSGGRRLCMIISSDL
jgi:hypothetical protein